ncbi:MAG: precorrin-6Y C5,15-methyltransferase (decarboxylating) subunit CbiT [Lachnospiraceae bacterium]|nr:precorrin-6Y C5,15-methyltransferase (decarboxylating) subunit CbiT [Lachnospiraceae bacterium]
MKINYIGCGTGDINKLTLEAVRCLNGSEVIIGPQRLLNTVKRLFFSKSEGSTALDAKVGQAQSAAVQTAERNEGPEDKKNGRDLFFGRIPSEGKRFIVSKTYGKEALSLIKELEKEDKDMSVSVLFSGDCSFFSGAQALLKLLNENCFEADHRMVPGISCLQYFASKLAVNWAGLEIISTHGTAREDIEKKICGKKDIFVLTGGIDDAASICDRIINTGYRGDVTIGINLSYREEVIASDSVLNIRKRLSEDNNIGRMQDVYQKSGDNALVVLIVHCSRHIPVIDHKGVGIPDRLFKRGDLPITKRNIRTLIASKLQVCSKDTLLDIGAGTGGVSIELSKLAGKVIAIEKEAVDILSENKNIFGAWNLSIIKGEAPDILSDEQLEGVKIDKVFIGGSGGRLEEIILYIRKRYPEAVICYTAILLETLWQGVAFLESSGYITEVEQISVSRSRHIGGKHMMMAENPIYIVLAVPETKKSRYFTEDF